MNLLLPAIVAALCVPMTLASAQIVVTAPAVMEPGQSLSAAVRVNNTTASAATWKAVYSLQLDGGYYNVQPPDPVYGSDHALGAKSWTTLNGKVIERGSLTDGLDYTEAGTEWSNDGLLESFQYVDLGQARRITRMIYRSR